MLKKIRKFLNVKVSDEGNRVLKFRVTDETVDRDNEILTLSGWDIKQYKKNPVVLYAHNYRDLPIAKAKTIKISKDDGMVVKAQFPTAEEHSFADTVYKLYKAGYMNTVSVGFIPKEFDRGENGKPTKITKKEMLEFSAVPVPANPNAIQVNSIKTALNDGIINEQEYAECLYQGKGFLEEMKKYIKEVEGDDNGEYLELDKEVQLGQEDPPQDTPEASNTITEPKAVEPKEVPQDETIPVDIYKEILSIDVLKTSKEDQLSTDMIDEFKSAIPKKEENKHE